MASEITIPSLGVAMEDALLVTWLKREGDAVEADEPVVEIETDKSTMELVAPASGKLGPHLYEEGAVVPVGAVIAAVYAPGDDGVSGGSVPAESTAPVEPAAAASASPVAPSPASLQTGGDEPRHRTSPRARRLAELEGTATAPTAPAQAQAPEQRGRFRALIAERVTESWRTTPHFTVTRDIDVEGLRPEVARLKNAGRSVTVTDLLLRAHALALAAEPDAQERSDVGLAVASEHGVMIAVIRDVLSLSLSDLAAARESATRRGREGRLSPDDLELPSSTLSNLGSFAVDGFTGIVAPGQTSLLTVGRIRRIPWAVGDESLPATCSPQPSTPTIVSSTAPTPRGSWLRSPGGSKTRAL